MSRSAVPASISPATCPRRPRRRLAVLLALLAAAGIVLLRLLSRRRSLPCPPWLSLLLENPYMERFAGAAALVEHLDVAPGMTVLDAGCGPGRLTVPLARAVGPAGGVTAVDIQTSMLQRARSAVAAAGMENVTFLHAGLGAGRLPAATFDRAVLVTVLGEIPDREAALAEIFRALKPGGILSIVEVLPDPHYQTRRTVERLTRATGFLPGAARRRGPGYVWYAVRPAGDVRVAPPPADRRSRLRRVQELLRAPHATPPQLAALQQERLHDLVACARAASPFYRAQYAHLPVDWRLEDLPCVDKRLLMDAFDDWVTDPAVTLAGVRRFVADPARAGTPFLGRYLVYSTSGTSGSPGLFLHDREAQFIYDVTLLLRGWRAWLGLPGVLGSISPRFREVLLVTTGAHYAGVVTGRRLRRRYPWLAGRLNTISILLPSAEQIAALNRLQPTVLVCYPTALPLLAAAQEAGRLAIYPRLIITAGEWLLPAAAAGAAAVFGCPVRDFYGCSEHLTMAQMCSAGKLHANVDWLILEPVDADYRPVPAGVPSHTTLITNLANRIQPLIRYDLGDAVTLLPEHCTCDSRLPLLSVAGRQDEILTFPGRDAAPVHILPMALATLLELTPGVARYQAIQTGPAALKVRLAVEAGAGGDAVWRDAAARLRTFLTAQGVGDVELRLDSEPPRRDPRTGKFRQVFMSTNGALQR